MTLYTLIKGNEMITFNEILQKTLYHDELEPDQGIRIFSPWRMIIPRTLLSAAISVAIQYQKGFEAKVPEPIITYEIWGG